MNVATKHKLTLFVGEIKILTLLVSTVILKLLFKCLFNYSIQDTFNTKYVYVVYDTITEVDPREQDKIGTTNLDSNIYQDSRDLLIVLTNSLHYEPVVSETDIDHHLIKKST